MQAPHLRAGAEGEDAAADFLRDRGYVILARNWRYKSWELDLVCRDGDTLVFVEVKTRAAGSMAGGAQAVNRTKISRLARAASHYLSSEGCWDRPCRFDVVSVTRSAAGCEVEHIVNAFDISDALGGGNAAWQPW